MFASQDALYASGTTDLFWSVILSQAISDIYYSLREPFYWQASKLVVASLERRDSLSAVGTQEEASET